MSEVMAGDKAIGGYFELGLPKSNSESPHKNAIKFQSARAAFRALLKQKKPTKVWMPKYICNGMLQPLLDESVDVGWYDLNGEFAVEDNLKLGETEWLLYVNYFGVCESVVEKILNRFPAARVVLDYSQAFYCDAKPDALATIYSPRKFFGVPDGGFLVTKLSIHEPAEHDESSISRMAHLLRRIYSSPESGYPDYQEAELSLCDSEPKRMSGLTSKILHSIDYDFCQRRRIENFNHLHQRLSYLNQFQWDNVCSENAPLCYPFMTQNTEMKHHLIAARVFVPTYWADALERLDDSQSNSLVHCLVPLPIDHRYGKEDMDTMVDLILEAHI